MLASFAGYAQRQARTGYVERRTSVFSAFCGDRDQQSKRAHSLIALLGSGANDFGGSSTLQVEFGVRIRVESSFRSAMCWTAQRVDLPQDLRHHSSFMALLKELGMGCGAVYYRHGAPMELFQSEHFIPFKTARNDFGTMPSSNRHPCSKSPSPTGQPWSNLPQHSPLGSNRFKVPPPCPGRNRGRLHWDSRAGL